MSPERKDISTLDIKPLMVLKLSAVPHRIRRFTSTNGCLRGKASHKLADSSDFEHPDAFQAIQLLQKPLSEAAAWTRNGLQSCAAEQFFNDGCLSNWIEVKRLIPGVNEDAYPLRLRADPPG